MAMSVHMHQPKIHAVHRTCENNIAISAVDDAGNSVYLHFDTEKDLEDFLELKGARNY